MPQIEDAMSSSHPLVSSSTRPAVGSRIEGTSAFKISSEQAENSASAWPIRRGRRPGSLPPNPALALPLYKSASVKPAAGRKTDARLIPLRACSFENFINLGSVLLVTEYILSCRNRFRRKRADTFPRSTIPSCKARKCELGNAVKVSKTMLALSSSTLA